MNAAAGFGMWVIIFASFFVYLGEPDLHDLYLERMKQKTVQESRMFNNSCTEEKIEQ